MQECVLHTHMFYTEKNYTPNFDMFHLFTPGYNTPKILFCEAPPPSWSMGLGKSFDPGTPWSKSEFPSLLPPLVPALEVYIHSGTSKKWARNMKEIMKKIMKKYVKTNEKAVGNMKWKRTIFFFCLQKIWRNILENKKEYVGNMKEYVGNIKKYTRNM